MKSGASFIWWPPCQGFSTSNQRIRSSQNENNCLFREFVKVARTLKPDWVVFENVKGILETEKGKFLEEISNSFTDLGYAISYGVLKASDFGVPQNKARFFINWFIAWNSCKTTRTNI